MKNFGDLIADTQYVDGEELEYKIIFGNENIVFIKVGASGSVRGCENKYFKMAKRIHDRMGATVICASNPDAPHEIFDEKEIRWVASERGFESLKLYLWGTSDGAYQNLSLAKRFPETEKWIGVNSSFITLEDLVEKLQDLPNVEKLLVCGTNDIDNNVLFPDLNQYENDNLKILMVEGADHSFSEMLPQFIQTIDLIDVEDELR